MAGHFSEMVEEIHAREGEVRRLRDALKPFADAAKFFAEHRERMRPEQELLNHATVGASAIITLADLQRAAEALRRK